MSSETLQPPKSIRGMTELNKDLFTKQIKIPSLFLENQAIINSIMPQLKKKLLKMANLKAVIDYDGHRVVILHPVAVQKWEDLPIQELESVGVTLRNFKEFDLTLTYENWRADELLKFILPENVEGISSFSRVGHIIHLNLKEHLFPYKKVIAQIIHDKMTGIRTVVNKAQTIDNVYRNFSMELLHGDEDYKVVTKENGTEFEFDFSSVYWNPRLSSEHERIVKILKSEDVLYDVFAGVGPFAIPSARKGVIVYANDLNPESYKWLNHNAKKNKVLNKITTYNKDGRDFLLETVKSDLFRRLTDPNFLGVPHFVMNLPAMAVEFLDVLLGFLNTHERFELKKLPVVHVYCFAKGVENKEKIALELVNAHLGITLPKNAFIQVTFVRNVAPNKDMMRVDFFLTPEILFYENNTKQLLLEPPCKKSTEISHKKLEKLIHIFLLFPGKTEDGKTFNQEDETTGPKIASVSEAKKGDESV